MKNINIFDRARKIRFPHFEKFLPVIICFLMGINAMPQENIPVKNPDNTRDGYPPIWNPIINTGGSVNPALMIINPVANPRINNIPISEGDWIGAFYNDNGVWKCAGGDPWEAAGIIFSIFGDIMSTPDKEGFGYAEYYTFKVFSWTTEKEYDVTQIAYDPQYPFARWYPLGISSMIDLKCDVTFDAYATANPNPICIGGGTQLAANIFVGTTGSYTYNWTSDPPGFFSSIKEPYVVPADSTTYFLEVSDGLIQSNHFKLVIVNVNPTVFAGGDIDNCANETVQLNGESTNYSDVLWETSGDGSFDNPALLDPAYTFGPQDLINGNVMLTITAFPLGGCSLTDSDQLMVNVLPLPVVYAGDDIMTCSNISVLLAPEVEHFSQVLWTTSGDGVFADPNDPSTSYTPGPDDIADGVTLTLCAFAIPPCVMTVCDQLEIDFQAGPTVNAFPANITKCENQTITVNASATNYTSVQWNTSGTGYFESPGSLSTIYHPSTDDVLNGGAVLTITANPIQPCNIYPSSDINLNLIPLPVVDAGSNNKVCKGSNLVLSGSAQHYVYILWQTLGDGNFSSLTNLNSTYYPGVNDKLLGFFRIVLTAYPISPCNTPVSDTLFVDVIVPPTAEIFNQNFQHICEYPPLQLIAVATDPGEIIWTTDGDGHFSDPHAVEPLYYPGEGDVQSVASKRLTMTVNPISPCVTTASDWIKVYFEPSANIDAGEDQTICTGGNISVTGTVQNGTNHLWTTSGDGYFNNPASLSTVYHPGPIDNLGGLINIILQADPTLAPCVVTNYDTLFLTIIANPTVNAGGDDVVCEDQGIQLNGDATAYSQILWSPATGLSNPAILDPLFTPTPAQIIAGEVTFNLQALPIDPCTVSVNDNVLITILQNPSVYAGADTTICENQTMVMDGGGSHFEYVHWVPEEGLNNPGTLNPVFDPTPGQIEQGQILFTITAYASNPCVLNAMDEVLVTIYINPLVDAGPDQTICEDASTQLDGIATDFDHIAWTPSTGLSNPGILNPVFDPTSAQIAAGTVTFTLTVYPMSPCTGSSQDQMTITIVKNPTVFAGNDATMCEDQTIELDGVANHFEYFQWTPPDGLINPNILNPIFDPTQSQIIAGVVIFELTVFPIGPCEAVAYDEVEITILKNPDADAGPDETICEDVTLQLNGFATDFDFIEWSPAAGLSNPGILDPVFDPTPLQIAVGEITFTLTAYPNNPCIVIADDMVTITIIKNPYASAGDDATMCEDQTIELDGEAGNFEFFQWQPVEGLSNPGILNPIFDPTPPQINAGVVNFELTVFPVGPCEAVAYDEVEITILKNPYADAGSDETICEDVTLQLNGLASDYDFIEWSPAPGLSDPGILNPVFDPTPAQITGGEVTFTLSAYPNNPCIVIADDMISITIIKNPSAFAGDDAIICEDQSIELNGEATNFESFQWMPIEGLSNPNALNPVFDPTPPQINAGVVIFELTVFPIGPCEAVAYDEVEITILKNPSADAGLDETICEDVTLLLNGFATDYDHIAWTPSTGLSNPGILNPVFDPTPAQIAVGEVTFTLTSYPNNPCIVIADDMVTITIIKNPYANAGEDATICEDQTIELNGDAIDFEFFQWQPVEGLSNPGIL
nr:hypothetical protein [Bacteroidota bacterium]